MKTKLSILFLLCLTFSLSARNIYLNTGGSSLWGIDNPKFAAWVWQGSGDGSWTDFMTNVSGDVFTVSISDNVDHIIFVRMNPTADSPDWNYKWNQTEDLDLSSGDMFTITGWGSEKSEGVWSTYSQGGDNPGSDNPGDNPETGDQSSHDYWLIGWIDGHDVGENAYTEYDDAYKFKNGKLAVTFSMGSYVTVKDDDGNYYYAKDVAGDNAEGESVTLIWANGWSPCKKWHVEPGERYIIIEQQSKFKEAIYLRLVDKATFDAYSLGNESGLENVNNSPLTIVDGRIVADGDLHIYSIDGKDVTNQNGNLKGIYIVRLNGVANKIIVQ